MAGRREIVTERSNLLQDTTSVIRGGSNGVVLISFSQFFESRKYFGLHPTLLTTKRNLLNTEYINIFKKIFVTNRRSSKNYTGGVEKGAAKSIVQA